MADQIPDLARPRRHRRRRRRRDRGRGRIPIQPYQIGEFIGAYLVALFVSIVGVVLLNVLFIPFYFLTGIILTRYISQRVIWNYYIASLADVAHAKTRAWLTWPISVPVIIWQIIVVHYF